MSHLALLMVCILSVEFFIRLNFLLVIDSLFKVIRKVIYVIFKKNISDHWKEKVIPIYALRIMKYSLQIFLILFLIIIVFASASYFFNDLIRLTLSIFGIMESMIFAFGYAYIRKSLVK